MNVLQPALERIKYFDSVSSLLGFRRLVIVVGIFLVSGSTLTDADRALAAFAIHVGAAFLLAYNNYRGRAEDALTLAPNRVLGGRGSSRSTIIILVSMFAAATALAGYSTGGAYAAYVASAMILYVACFENRYAERAWAPLKPLSALAAMLLLLVPFVMAYETPGRVAAMLLIALATWRVGWELSLDITDREVDLANGIVTPATRFGAASVARAVTITGLVGYGAAAWLSKIDIIRCLKRYVASEIYQHLPQPSTPPTAKTAT
ncbi:MAG TPA: hypothetical protein ENK57_02445 [Polyangiaceae bacterium]|nr:hypothetical protein [Polyangiaceae bacterium]